VKGILNHLVIDEVIRSGEEPLKAMTEEDSREIVMVE